MDLRSADETHHEPLERASPYIPPPSTLRSGTRFKSDPEYESLLQREKELKRDLEQSNRGVRKNTKESTASSTSSPRFTATFQASNDLSQFESQGSLQSSSALAGSASARKSSTRTSITPDLSANYEQTPPTPGCEVSASAWFVNIAATRRRILRFWPLAGQHLTNLRNELQWLGYRMCLIFLWLVTHPTALMLLMICWRLYKLWFSFPWLIAQAWSLHSLVAVPVKKLSSMTTSMICSITPSISLRAGSSSPYHDTPISKMLRTAANDFAMATQRNVQLRPISTNLMLCENEIQSLEISLKTAQFQELLINKIEECSKSVSTLSEDLGDFVASNSASVGIVLMGTAMLKNHLEVVAEQESSRSRWNLWYYVERGSYETLGSFSPFNSLEVRMAKAYIRWLDALEHEIDLQLLKSDQLLAQFQNLGGRLRDLKVSLSMDRENDKNTKAELFKWGDYNYWFGWNAEALLPIKRRLTVAEKNYAHIKLAQEYLFSTNIQMKEVSRNIRKIRALIRSSVVRDSRTEFEIHAAVTHVGKSFVDLNNTQRAIAVVQEKHVKALGSLIVRNGSIIIDYVGQDSEGALLGDSKPTASKH